MQTEFERLMAEAESQPFSGWDFAFLEGRYVEGWPSWDFGQEAKRIMRDAHSMLDLGTGGGEFLSSLAPPPERCCATEGFRPNLRIARQRLGPEGVGVVFNYCDDNGSEPQRGALPFRDEEFDFVMDRHEAFVAKEVARVLRRGGVFATQQIGADNNLELKEFFGRKPGADGGEREAWGFREAIRELESVGMKVLSAKDEHFVSRFLDVGAVAYYLKAIPWEVPGFGIRSHAGLLLRLHSQIEKAGSFEVTTSRFYIRALK